MSSLRSVLKNVIPLAFFYALTVKISDSSNEIKNQGNEETNFFDIKNLSENDYKDLIDLHDFQFIINPEHCKTENDESPTVLAIVHSATMNYEKRRIIRKTWGQKDPRMKLYFTLGAVSSEDLQKELEEEQKIHKDLIQGNFIDSYRNLTYKAMMDLKWHVYHCPGARYLLRTDDDAFVNTPVMLKALETEPQHFRYIMCEAAGNLYVVRGESKWKVTKDEYEADDYPEYCLGYTIIYSPDVVFELYKRGQQSKYFWIDDVHVTGVLRAAANISLTHPGTLFLPNHIKDEILRGKRNSTDAPFFFTTSQYVEELWDFVTN